MSTSPSTSSPSVVGEVLSTDEALKLFDDAYRAYLEVSDQIYSEGGANPERIDDVARGAAAEEFKSAASDLATMQLRTVGNTTVDSVRVQDVEGVAGGYATVTAYLCSDVSAVDVVDSAGVSKVSPDRNVRTPYEIVIDFESSTSFVSSRVFWEGGNFC